MWCDGTFNRAKTDGPVPGPSGNGTAKAGKAGKSGTAGVGNNGKGGAKKGPPESGV